MRGGIDMKTEVEKTGTLPATLQLTNIAIDQALTALAQQLSDLAGQIMIQASDIECSIDGRPAQRKGQPDVQVLPLSFPGRQAGLLLVIRIRRRSLPFVLAGAATVRHQCAFGRGHRPYRRMRRASASIRFPSTLGPANLAGYPLTCVTAWPSASPGQPGRPR